MEIETVQKPEDVVVLPGRQEDQLIPSQHPVKSIGHPWAKLQGLSGSVFPEEYAIDVGVHDGLHHGCHHVLPIDQGEHDDGQSASGASRSNGAYNPGNVGGSKGGLGGSFTPVWPRRMVTAILSWATSMLSDSSLDCWRSTLLLRA